MLGVGAGSHLVMMCLEMPAGATVYVVDSGSVPGACQGLGLNGVSFFRVVPWSELSDGTGIGLVPGLSRQSSS